MLMVSKLNYRYVVIALAVAIPALFVIFYDVSSANVETIDGRTRVTYTQKPLIIDKIMDDYQIKRLKTFLNPVEGSDEYYQNQQAMIAIRSGRLSGKGLFNGEVAVPESDNDFIFTVLAEEFGFVGCVSALCIVLFIVARCMIIANRSDIFFGRLIASATGGIIAFQTLTNVAVNTELVPNTGMIFPFISSGGSAMWVFMALVGLTLNVGMTKTKSLFED
jgi:rod shape determining protein RodA